MKSNLKLSIFDEGFLSELRSYCPWFDDDRIVNRMAAWTGLGDQFPFEGGRLDWEACKEFEFLKEEGGVSGDWVVSSDFVKARAPMTEVLYKGRLIGTAISFAIEMTLEEFVTSIEHVVYGCQDLYFHLPEVRWCAGIGEEGFLCVARA